MTNTNVHQYLKQLGEQERKLREALTSSSSTVAQRTAVLKVLNDIQTFLRGFFQAVALMSDPTVAQDYADYYAQARSKKGLKI